MFLDLTLAMHGVQTRRPFRTCAVLHHCTSQLKCPLPRDKLLAKSRRCAMIASLVFLLDMHIAQEISTPHAQSCLIFRPRELGDGLRLVPQP